MKIFFWAGDNWTGCTWYRCTLPRMGLHWLGHDVTIGLQPPEDIESYDAIFGSRISHPDHMPIWRDLAEKGKRLILDLDDDYFHMEPAHQPKEVIEEWDRLRPNLVEAVKLASTVSVASPGLVDVLSEYHHDVRLVPNSLPAQLNMGPRDYEARNRDLVFGWAGSASTVTALNRALKESILKVVTGRTHTGMLFVGLPPNAPELKGLDMNPQIRTTGFIPVQADYLNACSTFDVWLAPYQDTVFNQNKFPTKVLESQALGIPLIASAVRSYEERIDHGKTGFLVRKNSEWLKYMTKLARDPDLRQEIGLNARDAACHAQLQSVNAIWEKVARG